MEGGGFAAARPSIFRKEIGIVIIGVGVVSCYCFLMAVGLDIKYTSFQELIYVYGHVTE